MKVIEAVGKGFNLATKSLSLVGLVFVFNLVWNLSTVPFMTRIQGQDIQGAPVSPMIGVLSIIFIFVSIFIQGGALGSIREAISSGGAAALKNFANYGKKFYARLLGLVLLMVVALFLVSLVIAMITAIPVPVLNVLLLIIGIIAAIVVFLPFFVAFYVLITDDVGVMKAISNSINFIKTNLWRVVGLILLLILISLGLGFVVGVIAGIFSVLLNQAVTQILTGIASSAVNAYLSIVVGAAVIAYYSTAMADSKKEEIGPGVYAPKA